MKNKVRIITHSGNFHADELFAVALLEIYLNGNPYEVIRTRDMEVIKTGDYDIDLGDNGIEVYNPAWGGVHPYLLHSMSAAMRPTWKEGELHDVRFIELVPLMRRII